MKTEGIYLIILSQAFTFEEALKKLFFCKHREMGQVVTFKVLN
jgi:hypothetical protein